MAYSGLDSEVMGREITQTWGFAFIKVKSGMIGTLWVYSTLENLQHNSENYFVGRKSGVTQVISYLNDPVLF